MANQMTTTALLLVAVCWLSAATAQQAAGHARAASAAEDTRPSSPAEHCTYMQYRAGKCPHQKPPTPINFWDLLLLNPAGKKDDQRPPATECTQAPTNPTNGSYIDCITPATQGATCEATCQAGFTADTITATCGVDGEWSYSNNNVCTPVECTRAPTNPTNGSYSNCITPATQGATCEATCQPSFTVDTVTATCGVDGEWSYSNDNVCTFDPACLGAVCPGPSTEVVLVDVSDFPTGSNVGTITFGEFNSGTQNPVYLPSDYGLGDNPNAPNVSFGGFFVGQSLPNTAVPAVDGNATSPLTLDPEALATIVKNDATLGSTVGIGPIALLLSHPVPALQVELVFLASVNLRVDVTVYDAAGKARSVVRTALGQSIAVGFTTNDGSALISGLLVSYADGIATIFTLTEVTVVASSTPKGCCA